MTRIPNSNLLGHLALVLMLPSLYGIGSDVVLIPGNFQTYPDLLFSVFISKQQVVVY